MRVEILEQMGACKEAVDWCKGQKNRQEAWNNCERGDWMLWLLGCVAGPVESKGRKKLARVCAEVAKLALPYAGVNKQICEQTIQTVIDYHDGTATIDDVWTARRDIAYAASFAAASTDAAAHAAASTDAVAHAVASYASYAAAHAAAFAAAVAYVASASAVLAKAADIVREQYPKPPKIRRVK